MVKSFDTVDRDILDCALGRLGLPAWFRRVYFSFRKEVRLRFKLAAGLGWHGLGMGEGGEGGGGEREERGEGGEGGEGEGERSIPQGCPLSMVFHCCTLCTLVPAFGRPQKHHAHLKCTSHSVDNLPAARYTVSCVYVVGQEASPSKCVLLSTSRVARQRMTAWRNENEGCFRAVKLDVRDLGGHLDVTLGALAGTLSSRVKLATTQVISVGASHCGFHVCLGWCAPSICLVVFMIVRELPSLSAHSVHFVLRSPVLSGPKNST